MGTFLTRTVCLLLPARQLPLVPRFGLLMSGMLSKLGAHYVLTKGREKNRYFFPRQLWVFLAGTFVEIKMRTAHLESDEFQSTLWGQQSVQEAVAAPVSTAGLAGKCQPRAAPPSPPSVGAWPFLFPARFPPASPGEMRLQPRSPGNLCRALPFPSRTAPQRGETASRSQCCGERALGPGSEKKQVPGRCQHRAAQK